MAVVFFRGEVLEDEDGIIIKIPYEDLLSKCLEIVVSQKQISITKIISLSVQKLTDAQIGGSKGKYRESELFNQLENDIQNRIEYQQVKQIITERETEKRKIIEKQKIKNRQRISNPVLERKGEKNLRDYYRWNGIRRKS